MGIYEKMLSNLGTGKIQHNLAEEAHLQFIKERLGGEVRLKKSYPELYKILQYTSEQERHAANGASVARIMEPSSQAKDIYGLCDSEEIRTLNYDINTTTYTSSSMSMVDEKKSLVIIGDLFDKTNSKPLDGFAVQKSNTHNLTGCAMCKSSSLVKKDDYEFQAISTFLKIVIDADGKERFVSQTKKTDAIKVLGSSSLVTNLTINDPMPKNHLGAKKTVLYYNNRRGSGCDYYYDNVNTKDRKVEVNIDFSGSVTFKEGFAPRYVDRNGDFVLQLIDKGAANFNMKYWNDIDWSISGQTLSWKFPSNWHDWLDSVAFRLVNGATFYCKIPVMVEGLPIPIPIVISSGDIHHIDASYKSINPIDIEWGCFAKGTHITMADNGTKCIEEICAGDMVKTRGGSAIVQEIIKGTEETLALIRTQRGNCICVTMDHPMLTQDGWKRADELTAADILEMQDGKDSIQEFHLTDYHDEVFSIRIDQEEALIAEGFYTGDFACQNRIMRQKDKKLQKKEGYQQELEAAVAKLNDEMKRNAR